MKKGDNIKPTKEEDFKASELRYRKLFDTAQDGILLIDFDTGMILDANKFLIGMLGYSKADFLRKHLWDIGIFKDVFASKANFRELQRKKYVRFEDLPLEAKGGKRINVEFVSNVYDVNGVKTIQCNIRDITERKKSEEELKESEERSSNIFNYVQENFILVDNNKTIVAVNDAAVKTLGYSKQSILGKSILSLHLKADSAKCIKNIGLALSGKPVTCDCPYISSNKKLVPADSILSPIRISGKICILVSFRDITEKKKADEALKESEERYSALFNNAADAIFIADPATRQLIDCNKSAEQLTGYSYEKIISMKADELHPKDKVKETMEGFKKQAEGKIKIVSSEVLTKDKKRIPVEISGGAFHIGDKEYMEGIFRDMTLKNKSEEEQKKYIEELEMFKEFAVNRELKMIELQKRIQELEQKAKRK